MPSYFTLFHIIISWGCICQGLVECFDGFGTDIEDTPTGGNFFDGDDSGCGVGGETVGYYHIYGQQQVQVALTGFGDQVTSHVEFTLFEQRVADLVPLGFQEGVCHAATNEQSIDHADETLQDGNGLNITATSANPGHVFDSRDDARRYPASALGEQGWLETPVIARADLRGGRAGPLIVEEYDATSLVPPGARAELDASGNIVIEL